MNSVLAISFAERLFQYYMEGLTGPVGAAAVIGGLTVTVSVLIFDRFKWFLLTLAIYCGTFGIAQVPKMQPFVSLASASQGILLGMLLVLAVPALRLIDNQRWRIPRGAAICLFLFQCTVACRQIAGDLEERGMMTVAGALAMFLVLGLGLPRWLTDPTQTRRLIRTVSWAIILLVAGSLLVLVVSPSQAIVGGRLYGTSPNPQRFAALLALSLPFSFALFQDRAATGWSRLFHAAVPAFVIVMVIGSGSRMGAMMCLVGTAFYFRSRLGSIALAGTIVISVALGLWLAVGSQLDEGQGRLLNTENNRKEIWQNMVDEFTASPLVGSPVEFARENSFLATAASTGLLGLSPLALFLAVVWRQVYRATRYRKRLGVYGPVADLIAGSAAQFMVAWTFEGFLLGTLTEHMYVLYCFLAVMGVVTERIRRIEMQGGADLDSSGAVYQDPAASQVGYSPWGATDPAAA